MLKGSVKVTMTVIGDKGVTTATIDMSREGVVSVRPPKGMNERKVLEDLRAFADGAVALLDGGDA